MRRSPFDARGVLHIVTSLERGGAQMSVVHIVSGLRARGIDARVAFSSRGGLTPASHRALSDELARAGVPAYDVPAMRRSPSPWDALALRDLAALVRGLRPAIVHTHASKAGLLGRLAAARAGTGIVVHTVRGWPFQGCSGVRRVLYVAAERRLARRASRLVAVSPAMVAAGLLHGIGRRADYVVIRSGIDLARFTAAHVDSAALRHRFDVPKTARIVGTVMRLVAAKAPLDFVAVAAAVLRDVPHAYFVVIGDGPERPAMEQAIARAGLGSRFRVLGERDDIPALLRGFDVFVMTSHWEGMPRAVVEAAAAGVPVAATDVGGCRDIVVDGHSGVLQPPGATEALAAGVARLLREPAWAQRLAAVARARVTEDFDVATVVDRHVALYTDLGLPST